MELLRTNFGINFVGFEGWDGTQTTRDIAELQMLIGTKRYQVVPLEDPKVFRDSIKIDAYWSHYIVIRDMVKSIATRMDDMKKDTKYLDGSFIVLYERLKIVNFLNKKASPDAYTKAFRDWIPFFIRVNNLKSKEELERDIKRLESEIKSSNDLNQTFRK